MKIIYRLGWAMLSIILFLFVSSSHDYSMAASNSVPSVDSSATVTFDRVINMPDQETPPGDEDQDSPNDSHPSGTTPPGGGSPGSSGGGYSGGSGGSLGSSGGGYYGSGKPSTGSSTSLPQMGEYLLNGSIAILGILLVIVSTRYMYYKRALRND